MREINKKHSILGIISCIVGGSTFLVFLLAVVLYYLQSHNIVAAPQSGSLGMLQMVAATILPIPIHIFCLILGVISLFFPNRKKLFPILGTILNLIFALISLFPWLWLAFAGMGRV